MALETTSWELWWIYNRHAWLDLKARVDARAPATLGDGLDSAEARLAAGIDAALAALGRESQRDLVSSLLVALARAADDGSAARARECAARIAPFVANPDQEIGETAAAALGILRVPAAVGDLASLLHDDARGRELARGRVSTRTRAFAAYGLALAAARSERAELASFAAHHLARALAESRRSPSADLQAACVIALGVVPVRDVGPEETLKSAAGTEVSRSRAAQAAALLGVLEDAERPAVVRAHAPDALARVAQGASEALRSEIARELVRVLEREGREDSGVVRGAVLGLGRLADCDADAADQRMRAALVRALASGDALARLLAQTSLALVAGRRGRADDPTAVQTQVGELLLERLVRGKSRERAWAAIALGVLERGRAATGTSPSPAARAALRRALSEANATDQIGALAIGIGLAGDRGAAQGLLKRLADVQDPVARGYLAGGLGLLGADEAVEPLRALLAKSRFQPELLRESAIALALIGDPGVEGLLLEELKSARSLSSQAGLARAIGFAGTLETATPLASMLADTSLTSGARAFSAVALGMVLDRERLPWNAFLSIGVNYASAPASLSDGSAGILDIL
ncbi:MAG: hypothetical protein JNK02_14255 [Planctomycetes bacterium]|nr:hypothetical protein [Planctomycetota bacterium]